MAYTLYTINTDGTSTSSVQIQDGELKPVITHGSITSLQLRLPGRNYAGYGQPVDQDFILAIQHFAGTTPPTPALAGMIHYNTGTANGGPAPQVYNGTAWKNIVIDGSSPTFNNLNVGGTLTANNANITGAFKLPGGNTGDILSKAANGNVAWIPFELANAVTFNNSGAGGASPVTFNGNSAPTVSYNTLGAAKAAATAGGSQVPGSAVGVDNGTGTRGVDPLNGILYGSWTFPAGNTLTVGNITAGSNPSYLNGNWALGPGSTFQATYADLAERFSSDVAYDAGTVVELGGTAEITAVKDELSDRVFGVVSTSAAFLMNGAAGNNNTHPAIAVSGRVPVKVIGKVSKGDRLVSAGNGYARAAQKDEARAFNTIGRALKDKMSDDVGTVEAFVTIK